MLPLVETLQDLNKIKEYAKANAIEIDDNQPVHIKR